MAIVGIDLSLTATGVALLADHGSLLGLHLIKSKAASDRLARFAEIAGRILAEVPAGPVLVALEGYSFGSKGDALTNLAELRGVLMFKLRTELEPGQLTGLIEIPPGRWRKLLFGRGNLPKDEVRLAVERKFKHVSAELADQDLNVIEAFCVAMAAVQR